MRNALAAVCVFTTVALMPRPAAAWGFAGHQFIMRRAIELLPPELKPFFESMADDVVSHVIDPDLWRNVGWDDDPNHFLDFGVQGVRRVSVRRAAARLRHGAREVRARRR